MSRECMKEYEVDSEKMAARLKYQNQCIDILTSLADNILFEYDADEDGIQFSRPVTIGMSTVQEFKNCRKPGSLVRFIHPADICIIREALQTPLESKVEFRCLEKDGYVWFRAFIKRIPESVNQHKIFLGSIINIDQEKKQEYEDQHKKVIDPLTKLFNYDYLLDQISEYLLEDGKSQNHAYLLININEFHTLNKNIGYLFGDMILAHVAEQFKHIFKKCKWVGRVGGDKFAVFLPGIKDRTQLYQWAAEVNKCFRDTFIGSSETTNLSCSMGVAFYPQDGTTYNELFQHADTALYIARRKRPGTLTLYENCALHLRSEEKQYYYQYTVQDMYAYGRTQFDKEITTFAIDVMSRVKDVNSAIVLLLNHVKTILGVDCVRIYEVGEDFNSLALNFTSGMNHQMKELKSMFYQEDELKDYMAQFENGFFSITDTAKLNLIMLKHSFYERGVQSALQCAFYEDNRFCGCLSIEHTQKKHYWNDYERSCLYTITTIISSYLLKFHASEKARKNLEYQSTHDKLTNLLKLEHFKSKVAQRMIAEPERKFAVINTDIKGFKYINDTFGTEVGDVILQEYADILRAQKDVHLEVARDHSDKFLILIYSNSPELIRSRMNQMNEEFGNLQRQKLRGWKLSILCGVCQVDCFQGITQAIEKANIARESIQHDQRTECSFYDSNMQQQLRHEIEIMSLQEQAMMDREFEIYLQPKIGLKDNRLVGAEALVRWCKGDGQMLYPDQFIPIFEKNGFIIPLDYYVYESVCKVLERWLKIHKKAVPISVNVSRVHLNDGDFVKRFISMVEQYQIPSHLIELELTETCVLNDVDNAIKIMKKLQKKGFVVSIDDFGAGYSSLNLLKDLKTDVIKLDKEFLRRGLLKKEDKIIVSSIISMAKQLDMKVLSEGVETQKQSEFLRDSACDMAQGYLYAKPMPVSEFERLLLNVQ